ncbi:hypothetical protein ACOMHN_014253 [Nucella lapillus]
MSSSSMEHTAGNQLKVMVMMTLESITAYTLLEMNVPLTYCRAVSIELRNMYLARLDLMDFVLVANHMARRRRQGRQRMEEKDMAE